MNEISFALVFTFLAAGWVKGVTGMGLPTVAMGILGTMMPLPVAAALLVLPSFVTNVWQLFAGPSLIPLLHRLWPMLLCLIPGTVAGSVLLIRAAPAWSAFALGAALIIYASYALFAPALAVTARAEYWLSPLVGTITGVITGATGVFVMPSVPYIQALQLSKDDLVQALGMSFTLSTLALAVGLALHNAFQLEQLSLSLFAIFPALAGMWLGQKIRAFIPPKQFRCYFLLFLILLGFELVSRPFIA